MIWFVGPGVLMLLTAPNNQAHLWERRVRDDPASPMPEAKRRPHDAHDARNVLQTSLETMESSPQVTKVLARLLILAKKMRTNPSAKASLLPRGMFCQGKTLCSIVWQLASHIARNNRPMMQSYIGSKTSPTPNSFQHAGCFKMHFGHTARSNQHGFPSLASCLEWGSLLIQHSSA